MKNLKKVLALVMAFAMAFTMFAGAVDFSDVKPGDDYSAAISMLSDLEVISGNGKGAYEPEKAVTRAEACVLIANMMNGGKADTARFAGGSNFSDVAKGWWGESAIAYCVQNGITYGVGGGKFAPNREITDAEFVAMMTRAMGYDTAANPLSFPYGNYTAAVNNGLLDNMPYAEGSACTKGECAQIIYDALFADYARMSANLNVIHNSDDHDEDCTLIKDVFGLTKAKNSEKCTQHKWVIVAEDCEDEGKIWALRVADKTDAVLSDKAVAFDCTADVSALIGYEVILWGDASHAREPEEDYFVDTVKAVEVIEGQVAYDYNPTMDWEDDLDLDEIKGAKGYDYSKIDVANGNTYVLIDWNADDEIDYINATVREYFEVDAITSKVVKLIAADGDEIELAVDGENKDYAWHQAKCDVICEIPEDLEDGDIVEIEYAPCAYEETATWTMSIVEPEAKEVTDIEVKKGSKSVYFDDEKLELAADNFDADDKYADLDDENEETDWDVWQDANGYVIKLAESASAYDGVLFVRGQGDGETATNNRKLATLDVTFEDGTAEDDVEVAKDATIAGYTKANRAFSKVSGEALVGHAFKYVMADGVITELKAIAETEGDYYAYDESQEKITVDRENSYWMDKCEVIFAVNMSDYVTVGNTAGVDDVAEFDYDDQIDDADVKIYSYADITGDFDSNLGVEYDVKTKTTNKFDTYAVMGVENYRMFNDYSENIGLIYSVTYSTKNDNYTVKGYFAGEAGEVSYKTIDEDDMDAATVTGLANAVTDTAADTMVYALVEFNSDGEITDFTALTAIQDNWMDIAAGDYQAGRVALNHLTSINSDLVVSKLVATGTDTAAPQLSTNVTGDYKFADDCVFFVTSDKDDENNEVKMPAVDAKLSAADGFKTTDLSEYAAKKFVSYFNDNADKAEEYMVADIVLNSDGDVIMVVVFDEVLESAEKAPHVPVVTFQTWNGRDTATNIANNTLTVTYGDATALVGVLVDGEQIKRDAMKSAVASDATGLDVDVVTSNGGYDIAVTGSAWEEITVANLKAGTYTVAVETVDGAKGTLTVVVNKAADEAAAATATIAAGANVPTMQIVVADAADVAELNNAVAAQNAQVVSTLGGTDVPNVVGIASVAGSDTNFTLSFSNAWTPVEGTFTVELVGTNFDVVLTVTVDVQ